LSEKPTPSDTQKAAFGKDQIKAYLYQRDPHLWVDEISEISLSKVISKVTLSADHPTLAAHFPNSVVVPGSIMQEMCTQTAACLLTHMHVAPEDRTKYAIGVLMRVHDAKFTGFVFPPATCVIEVDLFARASSAYRFKARVYAKDQDQVVARFHFTLANLDMAQIHPPQSDSFTEIKTSST
jgi:3-hydroxymyristoyl/3-hydroxydecanoyl-(acyl carrier protein) dehydratase